APAAPPPRSPRFPGSGRTRRPHPLPPGPACLGGSGLFGPFPEGPPGPPAGSPALRPRLMRPFLRGNPRPQAPLLYEYCPLFPRLVLHYAPNRAPRDGLHQEICLTGKEFAPPRRIPTTNMLEQTVFGRI